MTDDDAQLVALIDNELDEGSKSALMARLAADEPLRRRYDALRATGAGIGAAFDALLEEAPAARLRAAIPAGDAAPAPRRAAGGGLRSLAAGIAVGLVAAGLAAGAAIGLGLFGERENWRSAVANYANLYTNETFSPLHPDLALQAIELGAMGAKVGANLTPETIALPDLRFTVAFMLAYERDPLGLIAFVDPSGAPVLLCILAHDAPDAPIRTERRGDLSLAWWSRGGRSNLVIGRMAEDKAAALAESLEKRI